jgi:hypothetical protein
MRHDRIVGLVLKWPCAGGARRTLVKSGGAG